MLFHRHSCVCNNSTPCIQSTWLMILYRMEIGHALAVDILAIVSVLLYCFCIGYFFGFPLTRHLELHREVEVTTSSNSENSMEVTQTDYSEGK